MEFIFKYFWVFLIFLSWLIWGWVSILNIRACFRFHGYSITWVVVTIGGFALGSFVYWITKL